MSPTKIALDREAAVHLLWRAQFGATASEVDAAVERGLAATVTRLVERQPEPDTFSHSVQLLRETIDDSGNPDDLKAWWLYRMHHTANPLVEKMSVFWHNHFATSIAKVQSTRMMRDQNDLIRRHALGSFRELLHGMARDVAMLTWLDGNANRKRHPNENFAREVLELFSLGVGNYTEKDIQQAARAFTGWHIRNDEFWFNRQQHDDGTKSVFGHSGNYNGDDIIKLCLDHPACPRFLAMKLLQTFVVPDPTKAEVDAVAGRIRHHDYAFDKVMSELLQSELFFQPRARRALIKSPLDLVLGAQRALQCRPNFQSTRRLLAELGQDVFQPPSVKGWVGDRMWVNSTTFLSRVNFASALCGSDRFGPIADPLLALDGQRDINTMIDFYSQLLHGRAADPELQQHVRRLSEDVRGDFETRVRAAIDFLMTLPEFQTM